MTIYELTGSLQAHEQRINRSSNQPIEQAFQAKFKAGDQKRNGKFDKKNGGSF